MELNQRKQKQKQSEVCRVEEKREKENNCTETSNDAELPVNSSSQLLWGMKGEFRTIRFLGPKNGEFAQN